MPKNNKAMPQVKKTGKKNKNKTGSKKNQTNTVIVKQQQERKQFHRLRLHMSPAAKAYFHALCDPVSAKPSCIPDFPTVPSRKVKTFSKGFFTVGTNGFGFVVALPIAAAVNDRDCVISSLGAYAGLVFANAGAGTQQNFSNADYVAAVISSTNVVYRIVSSVLRVRYAGTELNRGGTLVGATTLQHSSLIGLNFSQTDTLPNSKRFRPGDSKWYSMLYCPVLVNELQWSTATAAVSTAGGYMGACVQAAPGDLYEFEFYTNVEYNGPNVRGLSPGVADPQGLSVVHTALNKLGMIPTDQPLEKAEQTMQKAVESTANSTITTLLDKAIEFTPEIELAEVASYLGDLGWNAIEAVGAAL